MRVGATQVSFKMSCWRHWRLVWAQIGVLFGGTGVIYNQGGWLGPQAAHRRARLGGVGEGFGRTKLLINRLPDSKTPSNKDLAGLLGLEANRER